MFIHICKGVHTRCTHEIMRPYAGITRIRFMGMISAVMVRHPCRLLFLNCSDLVKLRPVLSRKIDPAVLRIIGDTVQDVC